MTCNRGGTMGGAHCECVLYGVYKWYAMARHSMRRTWL